MSVCDDQQIRDRKPLRRHLLLRLCCSSVFLIILLLLLSFVILKWKRENDGEEYVLRRRSIRFSEESQDLEELPEIPEVRQTYPRRSSLRNNNSFLSVKSVRFSSSSQTFSYPRDPDPWARQPVLKT
ncbi:Oidioi.mRNA.OKI2018_I69.XSR.g16404.t1.cds [Oikopleura dioica]|uniref:Oidioi.mRNA.OKI2018_I69.XSR.g16404.t1.cds n=1 Tax=Oikopleura dioica TaxID=34765 RepID=A0ABN7SK09_OIKDI|nr:Oidioi.mRNA.OKI2018_I69.XSR.g16404.t1.cds [Oikopleura dioica]